MVKEVIDLNWDVMAYFQKKAPEIAPLFEIHKRILDRSKKPPKKVKKIFLDEFGEEIQKEADGYQAYVESINTKEGRKGLKKAFAPMAYLFRSSEIISKKPLYYEAVVSAVTAFETYLKDTIINLITDNRKVEQRFFLELNDKLSYEKIKKYDYDYDKLMGYIVIENFDFFKLDKINSLYRKALSGQKDSFSIFQNENRRKRIEKFFKIRHLIVHNSGIVDHKYRKETNSKLKDGDSIQLTRKYILDIIGSMKKIVDNIENEIENAK